MGHVVTDSHTHCRRCPHQHCSHLFCPAVFKFVSRAEKSRPAGSATITSSLQCLKITPLTLYRTNSPSYHHLWHPYCWPCRHRNSHWFLPGRCAGQRVMWHTIQVGSPGQRPTSAAPHGAFLSFLPPSFSPSNSLIPSFPTNTSTICIFH